MELLFEDGCQEIIQGLLDKQSLSCVVWPQVPILKAIVLTLGMLHEGAFNSQERLEHDEILSDHKDWWLPILTTFLGVFLAASLTIYIDKSKSDATVEKLLKVSLEDTCHSWSTVAFMNHESGANEDDIAYLSIKPLA